MPDASTAGRPARRNGKSYTPHAGRRVALALLMLAAVAGPVGVALAQTGLPIPRFVSLRSAEVNVRTGPGQQYPIEWVYRRVGLPVEITAEFDVWRRIRDRDGSEGWVHQALLSGRRFAIVAAGGDTVTLTRRSQPDSAAVARLESGVIVRLMDCPSGVVACRVEIEGYSGWVPRRHLWGVYEGETVD